MFIGNNAKNIKKFSYKQELDNIKKIILNMN